MSRGHADINPQDVASELGDHEPGVVSRVDPLRHQAPTIGSFATGLANDEPRLWSAKQLVPARRRGVVSSVEQLRDEAPTIGSFATGLADAEPRAWSGEQMVGDGLRRVT
jgi:hypothetical protein